MPNLLMDPGARSDLMRRIRSTNTAPETIVFREMRRRGIYFQRHYSRVVGSPDLARPRKKLAVFIDGDFWHGREIERVIARYGKESGWSRKLLRNMARDREVDATLVGLGWSVLRVWESDIRRKSTRDEVLDEIEAFLCARLRPKSSDAQTPHETD
ncbi:very short patch repair endonuclease [Agromyces sp. NPDC057679]|uniref:very short patch repair endonuclease n=1 Tax=Agromyces sp. NPDC057679 TaxID=3346207 RepID=UPI00366BAFD9